MPTKRKIMKESLLKFDSVFIKTLTFVLAGFIIFVFYLNYPMAGYRSTEAGLWQTIVSTISGPDASSLKTVKLKERMVNHQLGILTKIRVTINSLLPESLKRFPEVMEIGWIALAAACLAGSLVLIGVHPVWAVLFPFLWAALPLTWKTATQGESGAWIIGLYSLAWSVLNVKSSKDFSRELSISINWFIRIGTGFLVGILLALGSQGWILLIGWLLCTQVFNRKPDKNETVLDLIVIPVLSVLVAISILHWVYPNVGKYSYFYTFANKSFIKSFFSGSGGWSSAVKNFRLLLPIKFSPNQEWFAGILLIFSVAFILSNYRLILKHTWALATSLLCFIAILILNEKAAPLWPVVLFSWFYLGAIIVNEVGGSFSIKLFSALALSLMIFSCLKIIEGQRKPKLRRYAPLRVLTARWSKSIPPPKFQNLYQADPIRQVLDFVYSQIEAESWLLLDARYAFYSCRKTGKTKTAVIKYIGYSPLSLAHNFNLSGLEAELYQAKLTPEDLRKLLTRNIPVYVLSDRFGFAAKQAKRLKLKSSLYLKVGFGDFEVDRLFLGE